MSKELEALKKVKYNSSKEVVDAFDVIENALIRLESIENASPSEALKCSNFLKDETINDIACLKNNVTTKTLYQLYFANFDTIEQALIKAQVQEKETDKLKGQMKYLTEVITEFQKILSIIKEKCVSVWHLMKSKTVEEYNSYLYIEGIEDTKIFILAQEEFDLLKRLLRGQE